MIITLEDAISKRTKVVRVKRGSTHVANRIAEGPMDCAIAGSD